MWMKTLSQKEDLVVHGRLEKKHKNKEMKYEIGTSKSCGRSKSLQKSKEKC